MFDSLKTQDKFNPYLIAVPVFVALAAWQGAQIVIGLNQFAIEKFNNKNAQK